MDVDGAASSRGLISNVEAAEESRRGGWTSATSLTRFGEFDSRTSQPLQRENWKIEGICSVWWKRT